VTAALVAGDGILMGAGFIAAHWMRAHLPIFEYQALQPLGRCLPVLPLAIFAWMVAYGIMGLHSLDRPRHIGELLLTTTFASGLGLVLFMALAFMLREFHASRLMLIHLWVIAALLTALFRAALQTGLFYHVRRGQRLANALIVGSPEAVEPICRWIEARPGWGLRAVPLFADEKASREEALQEAAARYQPREVVFIGTPPEKMLFFCRKNGLTPRFLPDLPPICLLRLNLETFAGLPTLCLRELPSSAGQHILKRALDMALSAVFLLMLSPLFILVAIFTKLDSPGPVFFQQVRIGKDGRPFRLWKFRSMRADAAKAPPVKVEGRADPRVTRVGAWLRRLSLDELPQLFNVLRGEMSLVGPRPETPLYVEQYSDWNRLRLLVKPGLAGLAQANGVRGNTTIDEKTHYDLAYIETQSPAMDLALIAKTVLTLPLHREAY
jgi:exopolysaccharide biosynthesis polyprenyl glycosylphosphotransferase